MPDPFLRSGSITTAQIADNAVTSMSIQPRNLPDAIGITLLPTIQKCVDVLSRLTA